MTSTPHPDVHTRPTEIRDALAVTVAGHDLAVFAESRALIQVMLADIRQAQTRVWLESYIIADDAAGQAVAAALCERARAGVDCRVIFDYVGSYATPWAFFARLIEAGVKVHSFHSFGETFLRFRFFRVFNRRNHRKLLIVDDRSAYFGGMNLVDQSGLNSLEDVKARNLPKSAGWRDVHVRMVGPKLLEIAAAFERHWLKVHERRRPRAPRWSLEAMLAARQDGLWFFDTRPSLRQRRPARVLVPLLNGAARRITVSMAYFIPQGAVLRALFRARRRGVQVRVIIPEQSDVKVVQWCTQHFYDQLLKRGIRIYERQEEMLHSKVLVIDDTFTVVGSCNLDPRSLWLNLEFMGVIRSSAMAGVVKRICAFELRRSRRVSLADHARRPWWMRIRDRLAWSLRQWL